MLDNRLHLDGGHPLYRLIEVVLLNLSNYHKSAQNLLAYRYILPFFDQLNSVQKIFSALEKDPYLLDMPFAPLIFYGEYGKTLKAQAVYNELLKDINPLAERTLKGYAKKYGLNI